MSQADYTVLYRRFRPKRFQDTLGQEHVTEPLRVSVVEGRVAHAHLLVGPRGCGKTTTARHLAMAVNCNARSADGNGCGECHFCSGVLDGSGGLGVVELDAASNRSIDSIRDIIDQSQTASSAPFKVFIIDEVHRLTPDAMAALLKTLEEPPDRVIFILCTTDPDKVSAPIRSRTAMSRFRLLTPEVMKGLVSAIADEAGIVVSDSQLDAVVVEGKGSARDTLSVLERVSSGATLATNDHVSAISTAVAEGSVSDMMVGIARAVDEGADPNSLATDLLSHWRNCLLALQAPELLSLPEQMIRAVEDDAHALRTPRVLRLITEMAEASGRMANQDARLVLEAALVRQMVPEANSDIDGLHDRLDKLEDQSQRLEAAVVRLLERSSGAIPPQAEPVAVERSPEPEPKRDVPVEEPRGRRRSIEVETHVEDGVSDAPEGDLSASTRAVEESVDRADDGGDEPSESEMAKSAADVLAEVIEDAGRRLAVKLAGATAKYDGETLIVETSKALSSSLEEELEGLVSNHGLKTKTLYLED